jgi:DNA-directed RNA polymerase specialized sigma24 family protein
VTLRYLHDLDYAEIAAILQCSEQSARANVYQALRRLRRALEDNR